MYRRLHSLLPTLTWSSIVPLTSKYSSIAAMGTAAQECTKLRIRRHKK